jgi:hypothetical protein
MVSDKETPFKITIYNKGFVRQGWLGDAEEVTVTPVFNGIGEAVITVGTGNAKLPLLRERGARVVIENEWGEYLIGGPVRAKAGKGPTFGGTMTFTVIDDWWLFHRVTGWPVPAVGLEEQNRSEYFTLQDPAETVLKAAVRVNAIDRLHEPVTVAPDLGRGDIINVAWRFHPLADRLFPAVETAGLGVTVRQSGAGLVVDCFEPALHPRNLTEAGGIITSWDWTEAEAEATDVVIGGQGEGTARVFAGPYRDNALAAALGYRIEVFRDARDSELGDVYASRAAETFAETAPKAGLSITLAETSVFRLGGPGGVHIGDQVRLEVGPGVVITDTLRSATLSFKRDSGYVVTPAVGEMNNNTDQELAQALARVAAGVRDLRRK